MLAAIGCGCCCVLGLSPCNECRSESATRVFVSGSTLAATGDVVDGESVHGRGEETFATGLLECDGAFVEVWKVDSEVAIEELRLEEGGSDGLKLPIWGFSGRFGEVGAFAGRVWRDGIDVRGPHKIKRISFL